MLKFKNTTTKEDFLRSVKCRGQKIEPIELSGKIQKAWKISDKFENEWQVYFTKGIEEWSIFNIGRHGEIFFRVDIVLCGSDIEIWRAEKNGKNIKSERLLKQFMQVAIMVSCYHQFGYFKI